MLSERRKGCESLSTLVTLDLHAAGGMHALVTTQVGELGVCLTADLTAKGLDAAVDVRMLLESTGSGKCLPALLAGVRPGSHVLRPDVSLQIRGVGKDLATALADVATRDVVSDLMSDQVAFPAEDFGAVGATKLPFAAGTPV